MNTDSILEVLNEERRELVRQVAGLDQALNALRGGKRRSPKRVLSTAARARIATAQKKRWAAWRKKRK